MSRLEENRAKNSRFFADVSELNWSLSIDMTWISHDNKRNAPLPDASELMTHFSSSGQATQ